MNTHLMRFSFRYVALVIIPPLIVLALAGRVAYGRLQPPPPELIDAPDRSGQKPGQRLKWNLHRVSLPSRLCRSTPLWRPHDQVNYDAVARCENSRSALRGARRVVYAWRYTAY